MTTEPQTHDEATPDYFRLITGEFLRDPYPTLAALRESDQAAVPIVENGFRMWLVTRDEHVRHVLGNSSMHKNLLSVADEVAHCMVQPEKHARLPRPVRSSMLEQDGDNHRRLRGMLSHAFTPRQVAKLRPEVTRVADELLSGLPTDRPIDLLRDYTRPLSTTILCDLVGIPQDWRSDFPHWQNSVVTGASAQESTDAAKKLYAFSQDLIDLKGREPQDDLFTELVELERYGDMSAEEAVATVFMVMIGGLEPSYAAANGALTLFRHPGELAKVLAEPTLWPACIDEILRYEPSFRILGPRHCPVSVDIGDVTIPPYELIISANSSANRDPSRFDHPDEFDIDRKPNDHLSFGHGPHRCIGAALGKLEMEVGLGNLFTRFPHATLALEPDKLRWRGSTFLRRLDSLPVLLGEPTQ